VYLADPAVTVRLILWVVCVCLCICHWFSVAKLAEFFFGVTVTTENDYFVLDGCRYTLRRVAVLTVKLLYLRNAYVHRDAL